MDRRRQRAGEGRQRLAEASLWEQVPGPEKVEALCLLAVLNCITHGCLSDKTSQECWPWYGFER
jgi:hypothetical protein